MVDSSFRAKVSDFGLSHKKTNGGTPSWMAPELIRGESSKTPETDVYSFGIILYEVIARAEPYEGENPMEVMRLVADKAVQKRPPIPPDCPPKIAALMMECVDGDPSARPTFEEIDLRLKRMTTENVDPSQAHLSMQARKGLQVSRANTLLYELFPPHIAEALRDGRKVEQESHDMVTVFFSDIVGYTSLSEQLTPQKVCSLIERLYHRFDQLCAMHSVFKVEVVGDAFMAVTNLVKNQENDHVKRCARFSVAAIQAASETLIDLDDPSKGHVQIRVGFHSGPVLSNVVGTKLPKFSLFGDTVNVASRMESTSEPGRIHCSAASAALLQVQMPTLSLQARGKIPVKGKADIETCWVNETGDGVTNTADNKATDATAPTGGDDWSNHYFDRLTRQHAISEDTADLSGSGSRSQSSTTSREKAKSPLVDGGIMSSSVEDLGV